MTINQSINADVEEFASKCQSRDVYAVRIHDKRTGMDSYAYYNTEEEAKSDLTECVTSYCMYAGKMKVYKVRYRKSREIWYQKWEIKNTLSLDWCSDWIEPAE